MNSILLISHGHRFIFVKSRKTGGSSVQIALFEHMHHPADIIVPTVIYDASGTPRLNDEAGINVRIPRNRWRAKDWYWAARGLPREYQEHMRARFIRRYVGRQVWESYLTFAVDRNPWDMLVSQYFFRHRPERGLEKVPFEEFILSDRVSVWSNWHHYTHKDQVLVDKLIRYDRLEDELRVITDRLGIPPLDLPRAKGQYRTDRRPYQEWYTSTTRDRVAQVFHREIEHFGWTFE